VFFNHPCRQHEDGANRGKSSNQSCANRGAHEKKVSKDFLFRLRERGTGDGIPTMRVENQEKDTVGQGRPLRVNGENDKVQTPRAQQKLRRSCGGKLNPASQKHQPDRTAGKLNAVKSQREGTYKNALHHPQARELKKQDKEDKRELGNPEKENVPLLDPKISTKKAMKRSEGSRRKRP